MCDISNVDTFLRSALYSATSCYVLKRLRQLLTSQDDAEGGTIIFIFKKPGSYRESAKVPRCTKMTHKKVWHRMVACDLSLLFVLWLMSFAFCTNFMLSGLKIR